MADAKRGIASMTGFGSAGGAAGEYRLRVEMRSVNARGLDIRFRLPPGFDRFEGDVRTRLRGRFARGTLHVHCAMEDEADGIAVDEAALARVQTLAKDLEARGFAPARADGLLALRGVLQLGDRSLPGDADWRAAHDDEVLAIFEAATDALDAARREEGARLSAIIEGQVGALAELARRAEDDPSLGADAISARLRRQVAALLDAGGSLDPSRLHAEAALLATKADIREELDRIETHCRSIRDTLQSQEPVGRRLDFLAQELARESNTLCAKSTAGSLTAIGLDMKVVVDQLREQVQNIE